VQFQHLLQLVVQLRIRVLQKLGLALELLLDVGVDLFLLHVGGVDVLGQVFVKSLPQLVKIVDFLSDPVHSIAAASDVGFVPADGRSAALGLLLKNLLAFAVIVDGQTQA